MNADLATLSYSSDTSGSETVTVAASGTHGGSAIQEVLTVLTSGPPVITAPSFSDGRIEPGNGDQRDQCH